jgi:hypothetical protein
MTAAEDRREELEAFLWQHVAPAYQDRRQGAAIVKAVLDRADACVKAVRPPRAPRNPADPPKPKQPPAAHYAGRRPGISACRPGDWSSSGWEITTDPQAVTCGHSRKTPAWLKAGEAS